MIFDNALEFTVLPESDLELKEYLNYNPEQWEYTKKQNIPQRKPNETDRAGWRGYDRVYSKYFKDVKNDSLSILEIGILHGYGIYAWQRYFVNSKIYGIDNDFSFYKHHNNVIETKHPIIKKAKLYNIDSTKEDDWLQFYGKQFDIIIDDGDHHPDSQLKTFVFGWPYLKPGGLYFIEDIGHRYGEEGLLKLSKTIESYSDQFETLEVYKHENLGLPAIFKFSRYLEAYKSTVVVSDETLNLNEYIVAIRKKKDDRIS